MDWLLLIVGVVIVALVFRAMSRQHEKSLREWEAMSEEERWDKLSRDAW